MRGVNRVTIIGNLGSDPEVKQFSNGGSITTISVATSEQWSDKQTGEKREQTEWHRIQFNNKLAEIAAQYLRKGSSVYVEGKLKTRKYQDQNGQDRYVTEIHAHEMQMLGGNQNAQQNNGFNQPQANNYQQPNAMQSPVAQAAQNQIPQQFMTNNNQPRQPQQPQQGYAHNHASLPIPKAGIVDQDVPF